jgi:rod shape determining protein RodA
MATRVAHASTRPAPGWEVGAFLRQVDYLLLAAAGALVAYGLWVLESVTRNDFPGDPDYYVVRQGLYVGVGVLLLALVAAVDPRVYRRFGTAFYAIAILLIALVVPLGQEIRGSKRWIELGFFNFQPSELGKVALILFLAGFVTTRARRVTQWRTTLAVVGLAAVPAILVFEQPDFGTALIYAAAAAGVLFLGGAPWRHLAVLAVVAGVIAAGVLWFLPSSGMEVLEPYQRDRLTGFVDPDADPTGSTYNQLQSITAVGSGGLDGRGVVNATQTKFNYLPEHSTDFIFSSLAEQRGFVGAGILLLLYAVIVWRGIKTIAVAPDLFSATVAGTIVFALLFQVFINVGMTIGIAPITGIPLPLVSYGGSSMITTMIMIGLLEAIHVRGRLAGRP